MRFFKAGSFILLSSILVACGNGDNDEVELDNQAPESTENADQEINENPEDQGTNEGNEETRNNNDQDQADSPYIFRDFNLEVDLDDTDDSIDVEYEHERDEIETSYRDDVRGINLSGEEAMRELDSIFSSFTFDESTEEEEVLNQVMERFDIPADAQNIEVEIEFASGTEKEYTQ